MLPSWEQLIREASLKYEEPRSMVFFRTLISRPNIRESAPGGDPWTFFRCWYSRFGRGILQEGVEEPDGMRKDEVDRNATIAQAMVHECSWMTRLFTTKKGYIGQPSDLRPKFSQVIWSACSMADDILTCCDRDWTARSVSLGLAILRH
jgi:hypothetical protein